MVLLVLLLDLSTYNLLSTCHNRLIIKQINVRIYWIIFYLKQRGKIKWLE